MPLMSPRSITTPIVLSLGAFVIASCGTGQQSPTSPTGMSPITAWESVTAEYFVTLVDETPPSPSEDPPPEPPPPTEPAPWSPGPPPPPAPGAPVPTPPSTHFRVTLKIDPDPVPYSGTPITDVASCRILPHTWYYDQYIHNNTGTPVTFRERENFFDGIFVSRSLQTIELGPNGTAVLRTRWCSGHPKFHYAQTRFHGSDAEGERITISGPWVQLLAP